ncbi:hypothetical protein CRUP_025970 [Coryphaenoides rupestris]|nr:hypothetical protein CRUP_025970 [Coryphaenoides rupestris]
MGLCDGVGDSLGGPFPSTAHRCHHKPKRCLPIQCGGGLALSPLLFHPQAKGSQILMDPTQKTVKRQASFCNAITFSNRPITKKQCCWSGALRLGFTSKDPSRINPENLPKYACPDLVSQSGFWAKALPEEFRPRGQRRGLLGGQAGPRLLPPQRLRPMLFFSGVRTAGPLWALIDVMGWRTATQRMITKKQCCWSGALRLGFTSKDPSRINPENLPKYACPDLVSQSGFWAKALPEEFAHEGSVVAFWVDKRGRVFYRLNDSGPMLFFSGVRTAGPLWALIDVQAISRTATYNYNNNNNNNSSIGTPGGRGMLGLISNNLRQQAGWMLEVEVEEEEEVEVDNFNKTS